MVSFSIVIPTYNQLSLLQHALGSVLQQEGADFEVIITDDSQSDDIMQYVASLNDPRISYHRHQGGNGAVDNWNFGLSKAQGRYLILMHHDEAMMDANYLATIQSHLDKGADIIVSKTIVEVKGQRKMQHFSKGIKQLILKHPALLFWFNAIGPCSCVTFKREWLQPFNTDLSWLVDVEWYYRLIKNKQAVYIDTLHMLSQHDHEGQITKQIDIYKAFRQDKRVLSELYRENRAVLRCLAMHQYTIINTKRLLRII